MSPVTALTGKDEFVNTSDGWVGATQLKPNGEARGIAVEPGGSVFLSEEEQILTANAPRDDADNPFANGAFVLARRAVEVAQRRPWGAHVAPKEPDETPLEPAEEDTGAEEETGATPAPQEEPPEGERAPGEEVATPEAVTAGPARMATKKTPAPRGRR